MMFDDLVRTIEEFVADDTVENIRDEIRDRKEAMKAVEDADMVYVLDMLFREIRENVNFPAVRKRAKELMAERTKE